MTVDAEAASAPYEAPAGLAGVSVARTRVSDVLGRQGFYHYRGYNAVDIARRGRVEDAWHLMLHGELPTEEQRAAPHARVPQREAEAVAGIERRVGHEAADQPLSALTALSSAGRLV